MDWTRSVLQALNADSYLVSKQATRVYWLTKTMPSGKKRGEKISSRLERAAVPFKTKSQDHRESQIGDRISLYISRGKLDNSRNLPSQYIARNENKMQAVLFQTPGLWPFPFMRIVITQRFLYLHEFVIGKLRGISYELSISPSFIRSRSFIYE